ncbi:MAG: ribose 5-phosphate isomerase A [Thermoplasmata archaeon]|nr:ribose 5-phosphate isomerase A [Thermoplasmata archaeon]
MISRFAPKPGKEDPQKRIAGTEAASYVRDGMVVGLGTGTTVYYTIRTLGQKIKEEDLNILGIPTSLDTRNHALSLGIPLTDLDKHPVIDLTIDGADEVDPALNLIKGLGGALLMEKIVASATKMEIIVVDPGKLVKCLGRGKLPVEVLRFGHRSTARRLDHLGLKPSLRFDARNTPFITDNNNLILDCLPGEMEGPAEMERNINTIPGVVENGLFIGLTDLVIVGEENGPKTLKRGED